MVFGYYGLVEAEKDIIEEVPLTKERGIANEDMRRTVEKHGLYCHTEEDSSFEKILEFLNKSFPVIVNFIEPSDGDGHYAVVVGYENGELILNDPWNGEGFRMSREEFESSWRSGYEKRRRWFMAVSSGEIGADKNS